MKVVKEAGGLTFYKKRSGRYAVRNSEGQLLHGIPKVKALVEAGLIKAHIPEKEAPVFIPIVAAPEEAHEEAKDEVA
jgi:succinylarginine dihydrolase